MSRRLAVEVRMFFRRQVGVAAAMTALKAGHIVEAALESD